MQHTSESLWEPSDSLAAGNQAAKDPWPEAETFKQLPLGLRQCLPSSKLGVGNHTGIVFVFAGGLCPTVLGTKKESIGPKVTILG